MEVLPGRYYSSDEESEPGSAGQASSKASAPPSSRPRPSFDDGPSSLGAPASPSSAPKALLCAADAVRAVLLDGEVAAALAAEDVDALIELLAIAKAMPPPSPTVAHVLQGLTRLLSAKAYAAARAQQSAEAADARTDAAAERALNARQLAQGLPPLDARARRRFLDDVSQKRTAARKEEAARAARHQRRVRSVAEQCRAAGLVKGCVDVLKARCHEPALLAAAARCVAALAAGDELSAHEQTRAPSRQRRTGATGAPQGAAAARAAAAAEAARALQDAARAACSALGAGGAAAGPRQGRGGGPFGGAASRQALHGRGRPKF